MGFFIWQEMLRSERLNMNVELVTVDDGQPKTTTLQIAQGLDLKHKTVF